MRDCILDKHGKQLERRLRQISRIWPGLHFLGIERVEVQFSEGPGELGEVRFLPQPEFDLPEGLVTFVQMGCDDLRRIWEIRNLDGVFALDVHGESCTYIGSHGSITVELGPYFGPLEGPHQLLSDTGLANLIRGACTDARGHLIVADWLVENLGLANLADALRSSQSTAPPLHDQEKRIFAGFLGCPVDRQVLLYAAEIYVWAQSSPNHSGRLLGLFLSPQGREETLRWVCWLPKRRPGEAVWRVWADLEEGRVS
jgi:hypothetical protein